MLEADVEALERGYADLLDPDLEWHEPGLSPEAGHAPRARQLRALLSQLAREL